MAAHRYWRAVGLESYEGVGLHLSELQLLAGTTRVDASATLTSNTAPDTGAVANLQDNDTGTEATWASTKGLVLSWDFGGSPQDVTDICIGSTGSSKKFPLFVKLQWSDNGTTWSDSWLFAGIAWPGARAKTTSISRRKDTGTPAAADASTASNTLLMHFGPDDGATSFVDSSPSGLVFTRTGACTVATDNTRFDGASLKLDGASYLSTAITAGVQFGSGNFTIEASVYRTANGVNQIICSYWGGTSLGWELLIDNSNRPAFYFSIDGTTGVFTLFSSNIVPLNAWTDLAVSRVGSTFYLFMNGVLQVSVTNAGAIFASTMPLVIGSQGGGVVGPFTGWIDEIRITKGVGRYSASYDNTATNVFGVGSYVPVNKVLGRASQVAPVFAPSAMSVVVPYGQVRGSPPVKARPDYILAVTAQGALGIGRIASTVKDHGTPDMPAYRRVRLFRQVDGLLVRETWSDKVTGAFSFDYIDETAKYFVVSFDHNLNFRAVIADNLSPSLILQ